MVIKVQFYNIDLESHKLHDVYHSDLVNRAHKLPILGAEERGTYPIPLDLCSSM